MSVAGEFIATCRRRGVEIHLRGEEVMLRGTQDDLNMLVPRLAQCVDAVHDIMTGFMFVVPPRRRDELH